MYTVIFTQIKSLVSDWSHHSLNVDLISPAYMSQSWTNPYEQVNNNKHITPYSVCQWMHHGGSHNQQYCGLLIDSFYEVEMRKFMSWKCMSFCGAVAATSVVASPREFCHRGESMRSVSTHWLYICSCPNTIWSPIWFYLNLIWTNGIPCDVCCSHCHGKKIGYRQFALAMLRLLPSLVTDWSVPWSAFSFVLFLK